MARCMVNALGFYSAYMVSVSLWHLESLARSERALGASYTSARDNHVTTSDPSHRYKASFNPP